MKNSRRFMMLLTVILCTIVLPSPIYAAPITVSCSTAALAEAITTANSSSTSETLELAENCIYTLTKALPKLKSNLTIRGNNATITTAGNFVLLSVQSQIKLNLRNITLFGGTYGIESYGTLDLRNVAINSLDTGVYSNGETTIFNSTLTAGVTAFRNIETANLYNTNFSGGQNGILNSGTITVGNGIFTDSGTGLQNNGIANIYTSTFTKNQTGFSNTGTAKIANSILWGNTTAQISGTDPTVTYSGVENGFTGEGNLTLASDATIFIDPVNGDYHLHPNSAVIDQGNNATLPIVTRYVNASYGYVREVLEFDRDNNLRIFGYKVDMGAYEYSVCDSYIYPYTVPGGASLDLVKALQCAATNSTADTINLSNSSIYTVSTSSYSGSLYGAWELTDFALPGIVRDDVTINGNDSTILLTLDINAIHVNYTGKLNLNNITIETITNGIGGTILVNQGSSVVRDVRFTGGTSNKGITNGSEGTVYVLNSIFDSLWSGIISEGNLTVVNSIFSNGILGIRNSGNATVINTTITNFHTGIDVRGSHTTVKNSVLWGNLQNQLSGSDGQLDVSFSGIQGGYPGTGNLFLSVADNVFVDPAAGNYHLHPDSPVINLGNSAALPPDMFDLDQDGNVTENLPIDFEGDVRVQGFNVDMGADETNSLVGNGGFEVVQGNVLTPRGWKSYRQNRGALEPYAPDKYVRRVCNQFDKPVVSDVGRCAFKTNLSRSVIQQTFGHTVSLAAGDTLMLSARVRTTLTTAKMFLIVEYKSLPREVQSIALVPGDTYTDVSVSQVLSARPKRIIIRFITGNSSGALFVDAVKLTEEPTTIPLPLP